MSSKDNGLGDIHPEQFDPLQKRYLQRPGGRAPMQPDIQQPTVPLTPEEEDRTKAAVEILVKRLGDCATVWTRTPNYDIPPPSAEPIDVYTKSPVPVPVGGTITIVRYRVPQGGIAVIKKFANSLVDPNQYPLVRFDVSYQTDILYFPAIQFWDALGNQIKSYENITQDLGNLACPCPIDMPWILREGFLDITVTNNDVVPAWAMVRFMGYQYIPDFSAATTDVSKEFKL